MLLRRFGRPEGFISKRQFSAMRFSAASLATAVHKRDREATAMVLDSVIDLAELRGVTIDAIPIVEIITTLHCTTEELVELLLPQTG